MQYYIYNNFMFCTGQVIYQYDCHGHFIGICVIDKFLIKRRYITKSKYVYYLRVRVKLPDDTFFTYGIDSLFKLFFPFIKNSIDK